MKQNVSPVVVVVAIIVVVGALALWYWKGSSGGGAKSPDEINQTISAGVAGGKGGMVGPPKGIMPMPGGAPAPIGGGGAAPPMPGGGGAPPPAGGR